MSTATTFPASEAAASAPPPEGYSEPKLTSWKKTVLDLLAEGASVAAAMRHVGYSSAAFYKACTRHPEFRVEAARARDACRAQVAEEFHDSEAYARMLVDAAMRDEALSASLRLRAALAILNRKGDHWLPGPLLAPEDTMDTMDTAEAMGIADTMDNAGTVDAAGNTETTDTVDNMDNLADFVCRQTLPGIERMDSAFPSAQPGKCPAEPATASAPGDGMDIVDTTNSMDTMDTIDTVGIQNPRAFMTGVRQGAAEVL